MQKTTKVTKEVEEVADVICDRCGKSCMDDIGMNHEHAEVKAMWGYGSKKDCERHSFDLCEPCYDLTLKTMGITPQITHYL